MDREVGMGWEEGRGGRQAAGLCPHTGLVHILEHFLTEDLNSTGPIQLNIVMPVWNANFFSEGK